MEVANIMYTPDYGTAEFLLEDHLREAAKQRAHNQLVREALADSRSQNRAGFLSQIKRWFVPARNVQQGTSDVRRATAV
jgi:hypothetical protein